MRCILQRCSKASVSVSEKVIAEVKQGFVLLLGFQKGDTEEDMSMMVKKIAGLRVFNDEAKQMNLNILQVKGKVLAISQFTLHAQIKKGNRPSFIMSEAYESAKKMYAQFVRLLENQLGFEVKKGVFGADMQVSLINDGPVTIFMDTKDWK